MEGVNRAVIREFRNIPSVFLKRPDVLVETPRRFFKTSPSFKKTRWRLKEKATAFWRETKLLKSEMNRKCVLHIHFFSSLLASFPCSLLIRLVDHVEQFLYIVFAQLFFSGEEFQERRFTASKVIVFYFRHYLSGIFLFFQRMFMI